MKEVKRLNDLGEYVEGQYPDPYEKVWAIDKERNLYLCIYSEVLTFRGRKYKFCNLLSRHRWPVANIVAWTYVDIPKFPPL